MDDTNSVQGVLPLNIIPHVTVLPQSVYPSDIAFAKLDRGRIGLINAGRCKRPGVLLLGEALALSKGSDLLGYKTDGKASPTVFLTSEMSKNHLDITLQRLAGSSESTAYLGLTIINTRLLPNPHKFDFSSPEGCEAVDQFLGSDWGVLILDGYSPFNPLWGTTDHDCYRCIKSLINWAQKKKGAGKTVLIVTRSFKVCAETWRCYPQVDDYMSLHNAEPLERNELAYAVEWKLVARKPIGCHPALIVSCIARESGRQWTSFWDAEV